MFRTIFSKLILVFIAILLFGFFVTGTILYIFLGNFLTQEKISVLETSGEKINSNLTGFIKNQNNPYVAETFGFMLEAYSNTTKSIIWIVDNEGYIRISQPNTNDLVSNEVRKNLKYEAGIYRLPDERQYKKVMQSKNTIVERGDFYGLFKNFGNPWLIVEEPYIYKNSTGTDVIGGAVYLLTPILEINKSRLAVFDRFLGAVVVSILITILIAYFFSLRISRPLKEINNAARIIAGGEFRKRLNIKSRDEIGELANSFNHMIVSLQNLEEMRRGFIANVSHELRTPMTSIRGFIEGILDGTIPFERQRDYLIIVRDETNRLNRLVNDLLDLAKMEAGETTINRKNFNLNELLRRCIIKLESLILVKNINIEANFEEEDMFVNADPDAIERVVINFIHNAIKFSNEYGKIVLSTSKQKDKVLVTIEDNGAGIDENEIALIWERFYKSDKSRSKDRVGTGLGLAIIKNIINEHNEKVWVESELGKGTKFYFTLDKSMESES